MYNSRDALREVKMRVLSVAALMLVWAAGSAAQKRDFDVPGPIELHIYLAARAGQEQELERIYREQFYPAVSRQQGFIASQLMRKPNSREYVLRHMFRTEELRMKWAASPEHQKAWPALTAASEKTTWAGFGVVHPLP
jgi:heme-degrading monooxygenase HmoA